jgi:putative membrane protein
MMARMISHVNVRKMNGAIIVLIVALVVATTGAWGIFILIISTLIGMIPIGAGTGRVHLSGCLLVPVILMRFNLDSVFLSL